MDHYRNLVERARAGERVLIDGATGSEALRRGAPELPNGWSGGAALSHPDIVRKIHAEYIEIGAEMIASNTFATGRNVLEDANVAHDFEAYNRRGVELAVEARDQAGEAGNDVVVAGGVSHWSFSGNHPTLEVLRDNTAEQVAIMRSAGAELISLEMMCNTDRLRATLDGVAAGGAGLRVWVGFSIGPTNSARSARNVVALLQSRIRAIFPSGSITNSELLLFPMACLNSFFIESANHGMVVPSRFLAASTCSKRSSIVVGRTNPSPCG